jgi:Ca2+-binding EF-hand superfamily protein
MNEEEQQQLDQEIVVNLKKYRGKSVLRREALNVLVKQLAPSQISKLRAEFEKIDKDMSGFIDAKELNEALRKASLDMSVKELDQIVAELDYNQNDMINYTEFIAATINTASFLTEEKLAAIFKTFDLDDTGQITATNIKDAFSKFGKEVSDEEVKQIMLAHDLDGGNTISLDEFQKMMLNIV